MEYNLYGDPQCSTPAKYGKMGVLYLNEQLRNESDWNRSIREVPPEFVGGKTGLHFYTHYGILNGMAATSPNTAWWSLYRSYGGYGLFAPNYTITDNKTQSDTTKVPNAFFISKHDGTSPTEERYDGSCLVLQIHEGYPYPTTVGATASVGVRILQYGQNPSPSDGDRTRWDYFTSSAQQLYSLNISQHNDSYFSNIGFAKITLPWGEGGENIKFIAVLGNFDDNGGFQPTNTGYTGCIMLFPEELWTDSQRIPDPFTPDPEDNKDDAFTVGGVSQTKIGYTDLANRSPYGLNSSYSGHVYLDQSNYAKFLGSVFSTNFKGDYSQLPDVTDADIQGGGYTAFSKIVERMKAAMNQTVLDVAVDTATDAFATSLGITEKIRKAMMDGILSAHVFPKVFTGTASSITTLSGYELNSSIGCFAITDEIQKKSFSTQVYRPNTSYLGYEPYTTFSVFAPFIGEITIPPSILFDNGVGGTESTGYSLSIPSSATIALYYQIDSYTGLCSCQVYINGGFYCERQGCCASDIPIVGSANTGAAMKGIISGLSSLMTGGVGGFVTDGIPAMIEGVASPQTHPIIGGSNANVASMLSFKTPIWRFSFKVPSMPNPNSYSKIIGGMTNQKATIGSFTGFCQFYDANLSAVTATQAVKEQILSELKSGVII